jgi:hypothetical protein
LMVQLAEKKCFNRQERKEHRGRRNPAVPAPLARPYKNGKVGPGPIGPARALRERAAEQDCSSKGSIHLGVRC